MNSSISKTVYPSIVDQILRVNPDAYRDLAPKRGPTPQARKLLESVTLDQLFTTPIVSPVAAYASLAALWLWNDGLDECHQIVQQTPEDLLSAALNLNSQASNTSPNAPFVQSVQNQKPPDSGHLREMEIMLAYWHAVMHRREPDYGNSKYWFRRVGRHPVFPLLLAAVESDDGGHFDLPELKELRSKSTWDPFLFVDLCERAAGREGGALDEACRRIALLEWQLLFDDCYSQAVSGK